MLSYNLNNAKSRSRKVCTVNEPVEFLVQLPKPDVARTDLRRKHLGRFYSSLEFYSDFNKSQTSIDKASVRKTNSTKQYTKQQKSSAATSRSNATKGNKLEQKRALSVSTDSLDTGKSRSPAMMHFSSRPPVNLNLNGRLKLKHGKQNSKKQAQQQLEAELLTSHQYRQQQEQQQKRMPALSSMKYAKSMGELNSIQQQQQLNHSSNSILNRDQQSLSASATNYTRSNTTNTNSTTLASPFFSKNKLYSSCFMNEISDLENYFSIANNMIKQNRPTIKRSNSSRHRQFIHNQSSYMNSTQFIRPVKNLCNVTGNNNKNVYENGNYIDMFNEYQNVPQINPVFGEIEKEKHNLCTDELDEKNLFKTAVFKIETPKNAVNTKTIRTGQVKDSSTSNTKSKSYQYSVSANSFTNKIIDFTLAELKSMEGSKPSNTAFSNNNNDNSNNAAKIKESPPLNVELTKKVAAVQQSPSDSTLAETQLAADPLNKKLKRNTSKRRNTISSIALSKLSLNLTGNSEKNQQNPQQDIVLRSSENIFKNVQEADLESLKINAQKYRANINNLNDHEFTALDMALMLNHVPIVRILLSNTALENPKFRSVDERYKRICLVLDELEQNLHQILDNLNVSLLSPQQIQEYDEKLKDIDGKIKLYKRMKSNFEIAEKPGVPVNAKLAVNGYDSLFVQFEEPLANGGAYVSKYLVEWSTDANFNKLAGHASFIDTNQIKTFLIENLTNNQPYFVRVSCANVRGFGPYACTDPPHLAPSYWRPGKPCKEKQAHHVSQLKELNDLIDNSKEKQDFLTFDDLNSLQKFPPPKKSSLDLKKNIKSLFSTMLTPIGNQNQHHGYNKTNLSNSKFAKQIKKGAFYLVIAIYDGDKIFTTPEDILPMIEIDESFSNQINNDLQFLMKLSFNWFETDKFKSLIEQTISTTSLKYRYQLLTSIKHLQNLLELTDLGRVYHQSLKQANGSLFFVITKNVENCQNDKRSMGTINQSLKSMEIQKLLLKSHGSKSPAGYNSSKDSEHSYLARSLKEIIEYDKNCDKKLKRGFYAGFLKVQSNIELVKVLVSTHVPNILPFAKIRDNPNISNEEWTCLKSIDNSSVNCLGESKLTFLKSIHKSVNTLCSQLNLSEHEVDGLRIVTTELIEINPDVTMILICPAAEQICQMANAMKQNTDSVDSKTISRIVQSPVSQNTPNNSLYLPVQIFEAIHLNAYNPEFIRTYVKISIKLEIEHLASSQYQREAFSNEEILNSKRFVTSVNKYQKLLETLWKEARWIIDHINNLREKDKSSNQASYNTLTVSALKSFLTESMIKSKFIKGQSVTSQDLAVFPSTPFCARCSQKSNIYNQITKLPSQLSASQQQDCMCLVKPFDSVSDSMSDAFSSSLEEDIHSMMMNSDLNTIMLKKVAQQQPMNNTPPDNTNRNVYNLVTRLAKTDLNLPNFEPVKMFEDFSSDANEEEESRSSGPNQPSLQKPDGTSSSKSGSSSISSHSSSFTSKKVTEPPTLPGELFQTSNFLIHPVPQSQLQKQQRKITIYIDLQCALNLDIYFEVVLTTTTKAHDIIKAIIDNLNEFICKKQMLAKQSEGHLMSDEDLLSNEPASFVQLRIMQPSTKKDKVAAVASPVCQILYKSLDSGNLAAYYLTSVLYDRNEKILPANFVLTNLSVPWSNGKFFLRERIH